MKGFGFILLAILAIGPTFAVALWSQEQPDGDMKSLQAAEIPCEQRAEVTPEVHAAMKAKLDVMQARIGSLTAYVELLKTEQGQRFAFLEDQGNELLRSFQEAIDKAGEACGEGRTFDPNTLQCTEDNQQATAEQPPQGAPGVEPSAN